MISKYTRVYDSAEQALRCKNFPKHGVPYGFCFARIKMDIKDFLYAWCGYNFFEKPIYKIDVNPTGGHLNRFSAEVSVEKRAKSKLSKFPIKTISAIGYGSNKKLASNESANKMCEMLVCCGLMDVSEVTLTNFTTIFNKI